MPRHKRTSGRDIVPASGMGANHGGYNTTAALAARKRRQFIAERLLIHNMTQQEIADALAEAGLVNPRSGKAWSVGTINNDVKALRKQWESDAARDYDQYVVVQLAKIQAAQMRAWEKGDLTNYNRLLELEIKLTGTGQREMINQNDDSAGNGWDIYEVLDSMRGRLEERKRLLNGAVVDGVAEAIS